MVLFFMTQMRSERPSQQAVCLALSPSPWGAMLSGVLLLQHTCTLKEAGRPSGAMPLPYRWECGARVTQPELAAPLPRVLPAYKVR